MKNQEFTLLRKLKKMMLLNKYVKGVYIYLLFSNII